jgi:Fe2+ transport system protein B
MVSSCGTSPLSLLTGGGPNVAANTQVAKTASQTVGTTKITDQKITNSTAEKITQSTDTTSVKTDKVEEITINNLPNTFVMLLVLWSIFLWQLPSPNAIGRWVRNIFKNYLTFKNKS